MNNKDPFNSDKAFWPTGLTKCRRDYEELGLLYLWLNIAGFEKTSGDGCQSLNTGAFPEDFKLKDIYIALPNKNLDIFKQTE